MNVSIGEIVTDHSFAFLKKRCFVTIKKLDYLQAEKAYDDYSLWCLENNIFPDGKHAFYEKLLKLGIVSAELFHKLFMSLFITTDDI